MYFQQYFFLNKLNDYLSENFVRIISGDSLNYTSYGAILDYKFHRHFKLAVSYRCLPDNVEYRV